MNHWERDSLYKKLSRAESQLSRALAELSVRDGMMPSIYASRAPQQIEEWRTKRLELQKQCEALFREIATLNEQLSEELSSSD